METNIVFFPTTDSEKSFSIIEDGDGGGGGNDMWQQTVETRLSELRTDIKSMQSEMKTSFDGVRDKQERDFRALFAALIFVALGLAGIMAKGFKWIG